MSGGHWAGVGVGWGGQGRVPPASEQTPAGGAAPRSRAAPLGRGAPQPSVAAVILAPGRAAGPGWATMCPRSRWPPVVAGAALSPLFALLSSRRLVTLARGLAPAFLRFAGKRTDFLQFHNVKNPAKSRGGPGPDYYLKNYEDGELRVWGGERARQRGAAGTGRSCSACPTLPAPRRGRAAQRSARAVLPPYFLFPEREGARGLCGARPPARCRWMREQKVGTGEQGCSYPPTATPRPPAPFPPKTRAGSAGHRRGFAAGTGHRSPGMPVHSSPRAPPAALGEPCLSLSASAPFRGSLPAADPGLSAVPPGFVAVGRLGSQLSVSDSPSDRSATVGLCEESPPSPRLSAAPRSSATLPSFPAVLSYTKGSHLLRPVIHTKKLLRKLRTKSLC